MKKAILILIGIYVIVGAFIGYGALPNFNKVSSNNFANNSVDKIINGF